MNMRMRRLDSFVSNNAAMVRERPAIASSSSPETMER